jgi:hypothetical protein
MQLRCETTTPSVLESSQVIYDLPWRCGRFQPLRPERRCIQRCACRTPLMKLDVRKVTAFGALQASQTAEVGMWLLASQLTCCPSNSIRVGGRIQRRGKLIASVPRGMRQGNEFSWQQVCQGACGSRFARIRTKALPTTWLAVWATRRRTGHQICTYPTQREA